MRFYAIIPYINVQSANLHTSGILLGGTPLMASSLFAHHLARQLGVKDKGVIYIHHGRQDLGGFAYGRFTPAQRRGSVFINKNDYSSKNPHALSLQPTASCHLQFSLVIELDDFIDSEELIEIINNSRFAGGQIIEMGTVKVLPAHSQKLSRILTELIPTGFVIIDRQDVLLNFQQSQHLNRLQAFTQLLALNKQGLAHYFGNDSLLSFLSATNLGYALLEPPNSERTGVRQAYHPANDGDGEVMDTPHAFAEPLIGLVQYVSLRQLINLAKPKPTTEENEADQQPVKINPIAQLLHYLSADLTRLFWRYDWQSHQGGDVFLLTQSATQDF